MSVITVRGVTHRYGRSTALSDVSFSVEAGEVVALAGPSGSGKSTLVHLVAGFDAAQEGDVRVLERRPAKVRDWSLLAVVPQQHGLLTALSAAENIRLPGLTHRRTTHDQALAAMDLLDVATMSHRPVEALSLGEQQRVAVARALANDPRAMVLDEPTAHQDEGHLTVMVDALRSAAAAGTAVVVATHDPTLLAAADRTVRLADGRVVGREGRPGG
jgi:ABC-type lipoprotein export system ATPase subunit